MFREALLEGFDGSSCSAFVVIDGRLQVPRIVGKRHERVAVLKVFLLKPSQLGLSRYVTIKRVDPRMSVTTEFREMSTQSSQWRERASTYTP